MIPWNKKDSNNNQFWKLAQQENPVFYATKTFVQIKIWQFLVQ